MKGDRTMKKRHNGVVLAEGEVTGHAHVLEADVEVRDGAFEIKNETQVVHEEHGTIKLPAGEWEYGQVLEYDYFAEEAREVRD